MSFILWWKDFIEQYTLIYITFKLILTPFEIYVVYKYFKYRKVKHAIEKHQDKLLKFIDNLK